MFAQILPVTVDDLTRLAPGWDELIVADLAREVEKTTAVSVPELRLALAIRGYQEMTEILAAETKGKRGIASLRIAGAAPRQGEQSALMYS